MGAWCSGLARRPVKPKVAGSNPVVPAIFLYRLPEIRQGMPPVGAVFFAIGHPAFDTLTGNMYNN